ncbi:hypothetical protein V5O48_015169, partial [Marasmius crinis-equi]
TNSNTTSSSFSILREPQGYNSDSDDDLQTPSVPNFSRDDSPEPENIMSNVYGSAGPNAGPSSGPSAYVFPSAATQPSPAPNPTQSSTTTSATTSQPQSHPTIIHNHVADFSTLDIGNIAALPPPHARDAPRKFTGSYTQVEDWIRHYERLLYKHRITSPKDRCEGILDYCSYKVKQTLRGLNSYRVGSWELMKADILKLYDAERARQRYQPSDIQALAL